MDVRKARLVLLCAIFLHCMVFVSAVAAENGVFIKRFFGFDDFLSGAPAVDGGYLAALELNSDELYLGDTTLVRLSNSGVVQWKRTLGNQLKDHVYRSTQMPDGGWVVTGDTYECPMSRLCYGHPVIIRLNASGGVRWQRTLDTVEQGGMCCSLILRFGTELLVAGTIYVGTQQDVLLAALDDNGDLLWSRTYGGSGYERPEALIPACDGVLVFGDTDTGNTNEDLFVMKIDGSGNLLWARRFRTGEFDYVRAAAHSGCGAYVGAVSGTRGVVLRLNADGLPVWRRKVTVRGKDFRIASVAESNGVVVAGTSDSTGVLVKLNASGNVQWARSYQGVQGEIRSVTRNTPGGLHIAGVIYEPHRDVMMVANVNAQGGSGKCSLLSPADARSVPFTIPTSILHFTQGAVNLAVTDLQMRYRSYTISSSVCR